MEQGSISVSISEIMRREMQDFGEFILRKQCQDLGVPYDDIRPEDIPHLALKLSGALSSFCGKEKSSRIYREIKKLGNINAVINRESDISKKADHLASMGGAALNSGDWAGAEEYFKRMLDEAVRSHNRRIEVDARLLLGYLMKEKGSLDRATEHYNKALEASRRANFDDSLAISLQGLGYVHWRRGDYASAELCMEKAHTLSMTDGLEHLRASILIDLGSIRSSKGENESCLMLYNEAAKILRDINDERELARVENNTGDVYLVMEEWDQAIKHFQQGNKYARNTGNQNLVAWTLFNGAEALIAMGDLLEAKEDLEEAEVLLEQMGDRVGLLAVNRIWGMYHMAAGAFGSALKRLEAARKMALEIGLPGDIAELDYRLGVLHRERGDLEAARLHLKRSATTYSDIGSEEEMERSRKLLEEVEADYEGFD